MVLVLVLAVVSHGLLDLGKQLLDRLFFGEDVQLLRANPRR